MISVQEALTIIHDNTTRLGTERIHFSKAEGRVLSEDILADRPFPPFNRATMDGIAISKADWDNGQRSFPISGEQFAGAPQQTLQPATCLEIMTGAVVSEGADVVIRYEDVKIENGVADVMIDEIRELMNVHLAGEDAKKGEVLIQAGKQLSHGDLGILSSVGLVEVLVRKLPRVAIISTGDELVDPDETPQFHQIRKSNVFTLGSLLDRQGIGYALFHIDDEFDEVKKELSQILDQFGLILLSGGVSKGKRDYIPEALEQLGVKKHFHRILQRPGKPLWFGSNDNTTVFGFPGNPVSTIVCYTVYCRPWLQSSLGLSSEKLTAQLTDDIRFEKDLTYFVSASTKVVDGMICATPLRGNGSGDLVSLSRADGFLELPANESHFKEGAIFGFHPL